MEHKIWIWIWICSIFLLVTTCSCASRKKYEETKCHFYNHTACTNSSEGCTSVIQNCKSGENDKPSYCYAVWINDTKTNTLEIQLKVI